MYEAVLIFLLSLGCLNKASRPFAAIMVANMAINYLIVIQYGLFIWVPVVDAAAFISMAWFTLKRPSWWTFLVSELAFAAVISHVAYWTLDAFGLYFGSQYQIVLGGAFILSALILVLGGYDVGKLVGTAWRSLASAFDMRRRHGYSGSSAIQDHSEDAR